MLYTAIQYTYIPLKESESNNIYYGDQDPNHADSSLIIGTATLQGTNVLITINQNLYLISNPPPSYESISFSYQAITISDYSSNNIAGVAILTLSEKFKNPSSEKIRRLSEYSLFLYEDSQKNYVVGMFLYPTLKNIK